MGSESETTLKHNRRAWRKLALQPRVLVDVSQVDTRCKLLGATLASPIIVAPVSMQRWAHPQGATAVAAAAAAANTACCVSCSANTPLEEVAKTAPAAPKWFQLYVLKDRALTMRLVRRAESSGYTALVVTVDHPVLGNRERPKQQQPAGSFAMPSHLELANFAGDAVLAKLPSSQQKGAQVGGPGRSWAQYVAQLYDQSLTWDDIRELVSSTRLPVLVKGVMCGTDAAQAVACGVAGIIVSNHGGRQLDGAAATAQVLPQVAAAVRGSGVPVLVDGGIRRGVDVVRALALGATAVCVGRPIVWGLALGGTDGVLAVLQTLRRELETAMALCGCPTLADIGPQLLLLQGRRSRL